MSTPERSTHKLQDDAVAAGELAAGGLGAVEIGAIVLLGLLVCPPLAILTVVVVAPILVITVVLGLLAAVVSTPYLLFHHFRGRGGGHLSLLLHRLHTAGRALIDLAPHRILADVRKLTPRQ